jgi:membrane-associated phospholipid phosphatase
LQNTLLLQRTQYENLRLALYLSLLLCIAAGMFLLAYGKTGSFLIINGAHSPALDVLFRYGTFLGDGLIYIPLVLYCIFFNRPFLIPMVLSLVLCLLLTHVLKQFVFPNDLRPLSLEAQHITIHKVQGLYISRKHSFPSGHTATAFSTALLLATVLKKRSWALLLPLVPFLVAYSRVYLAQHYVSDVLGGMLLGMITAIAALWLGPILLNKLPQSVQRKLKE